MSGCIIGCYGAQRSGKTLLAYLLAEDKKAKGAKVYSNMFVPDPQWTQISALTDIPLDYKPKVLLLDEAYYFMDSRSWKDNKNATIFFNTIGKQDILLILTAPNPNQIEMRIRDQHNYLFLARDDNNRFSYRVFDCFRGTHKDFTLDKTSQLFSKLKYDTKQVPDWVDCDLKDFNNNNFNNKKLIIKEGRL